LPGPLHYRHCADAVLGAALDNSIAIRYVNQNIAAAIKKAYDVELLEQDAAMFSEDGLAVLEFVDDFYRAYLTTGDASVTRVLGNSQLAFDTSSFRARDVAYDALHFGVFKTVYNNLVIRAEPSELCTDRAGCATIRATQDPPSERHSNNKNDSNNNSYDPFHDDSTFLGVSGKDAFMQAIYSS
jgi:hypothetical protein